MSIKDTTAKINKMFGQNSIVAFGEHTQSEIASVPSGILSLDMLIGCGGIPLGRILEAYGPEGGGKTTLALTIAAQVQKAGRLAAYIDAEHSLSPNYAADLGVDIDKLLISQPDYGEQGLQIAEELIKSGDVGIVIIDSIASLIPKSELDGDITDNHMGLAGRMMSAAMRRLTGVTHKSQTILFCLNQLREKIGVMFGCLHADTLINFADGRSIPIRKVVEDRIEGYVWCTTPSGTVVKSRITSWHFNGFEGNSNNWIHIQTESVGTGGGRFGLTVTKDHKVLTQKGWVPAGSLVLDDVLSSRYETVFNGTVRDFLSGSLVGDSSLSIRAKNTACLIYQDNLDIDYVQWKIKKLSPALSFKKNGKRFDSNHSYELAKIKKTLTRRDPLFLLNDNYSDLGLAVWVMDDAHLDTSDAHLRYTISVKRFRRNQTKLQEIVEAFERRGLPCTYRESDGTIAFCKSISLEIARRIQEFVPPCMERKLPIEFQGKYKEFELHCTKSMVQEYTPIVKIRPPSKRQMRQTGKYDISVDNWKNYMVGGVEGGVTVHNSPETQPGGRALKFYSSIRMDIRRTATLKDGDVNYGARTKIKLVKNKMGSPFQDTEVDLIFGKGFSRAGDLFDLAKQRSLIEASGAWVTIYGERLQGRANAVTYLEENKEVADKLEAEIRKPI